MRKQYVLIGLLALMFQFSQAQFTLDGEFRPRTEYRHGYGNLIANDADAGFATSTRLRLNAGYKTEAYQFYVSLQDVLVWGENRQLKPEDSNNSFSSFCCSSTTSSGRLRRTRRYCSKIVSISS